MMSKPVKVTIDTINVLAVPVNATLVSEWMRSMKLSRLASSEMVQDAEHERKRRAALTDGENGGDPMSWLQRILDNLRVEVRNVHIRFEDSRVSDPSRWFSIGVTLAEASLRGGATAADEAAAGGEAAGGAKAAEAETDDADDDDPAFVNRASSLDATRRSGTIEKLGLYWDWSDDGERGAPKGGALASLFAEEGEGEAMIADAVVKRHEHVSRRLTELVSEPHEYIIEPLSLSLSVEENELTVAMETHNLPRRLIAIAPFSLRLRTHRAQLECALRASAHWSLLRRSASAIERTNATTAAQGGLLTDAPAPAPTPLGGPSDSASPGGVLGGGVAFENVAASPISPPQMPSTPVPRARRNTVAIMLRERYIALWTRRRGVKRSPDGDTRFETLSAAEDAEREEYEAANTFEDVVVARGIADEALKQMNLKFEAASKAAAEAQKEMSWGAWLASSWAPAAVDFELTAEERSELSAMIDGSTQAQIKLVDDALLPPLFCKMLVRCSLAPDSGIDIVGALKDEMKFGVSADAAAAGAPMISFRIGGRCEFLRRVASWQLSAQCTQLRVEASDGRALVSPLELPSDSDDPRASESSFQEELLSMTIESLDLDANTIGRRKRAAPTSPSGKPLAVGDLLPEKHSCDTWVALRSKPLALRYDDNTYGRLAHFFALPGGRKLQSEASRQLQERSAGLAAVASRRRVGCDICIMAPIIILPERSGDDASPSLVVDLGKLEFRNSSSARQKVDSVFGSSSGGNFGTGGGSEAAAEGGDSAGAGATNDFGRSSSISVHSGDHIDTFVDFEDDSDEFSTASDDGSVSDVEGVEDRITFVDTPSHYDILALTSRAAAVDEAPRAAVDKNVDKWQLNLTSISVTLRNSSTVSVANDDIMYTLVEKFDILLDVETHYRANVWGRGGEGVGDGAPPPAASSAEAESPLSRLVVTGKLPKLMAVLNSVSVQTAHRVYRQIGAWQRVGMIPQDGGGGGDDGDDGGTTAAAAVFAGNVPKDGESEEASEEESSSLTVEGNFEIKHMVVSLAFGGEHMAACDSRRQLIQMSIRGLGATLHQSPGFREWGAHLNRLIVRDRWQPYGLDWHFATLATSAPSEVTAALVAGTARRVHAAPPVIDGTSGRRRRSSSGMRRSGRRRSASAATDESDSRSRRLIQLTFTEQHNADGSTRFLRRARFHRLHFEWNPETIAALFRFKEFAYASAGGEQPSLGTAASIAALEDEVSSSERCTEAVPAERTESAVVEVTPVSSSTEWDIRLDAVSFCLNKEAGARTLMVIALSDVHARVSRINRTKINADVQLGNLVCMDPASSAVHHELLSLKTAASRGGENADAALGVTFKGGHTDDAATEFGELNVELQPAHMVYVHQIWMESLDYIFAGFLGTLLASSAASAGEIMNQNAGEADEVRIVKRVRIIRPTVTIPCSSKSPLCIVATLEDGIDILTSFETVEGGGEEEVLTMNVQGMMLLCDGRKLLGKDTNLSIRHTQTSLVDEESDSAPPIALTTIAMEFTGEGGLGVEATLSRGEYIRILETIYSNFGEIARTQDTMSTSSVRYRHGESGDPRLARSLLTLVVPSMRLRIMRDRTKGEVASGIAAADVCTHIAELDTQSWKLTSTSTSTVVETKWEVSEGVIHNLLPLARGLVRERGSVPLLQRKFGSGGDGADPIMTLTFVSRYDDTALDRAPQEVQNGYHFNFNDVRMILEWDAVKEVADFFRGQSLEELRRFKDACSTSSFGGASTLGAAVTTSNDVRQGLTAGEFYSIFNYVFPRNVAKWSVTRSEMWAVQEQSMGDESKGLCRSALATGSAHWQKTWSRYSSQRCIVALLIIIEKRVVALAALASDVNADAEDDSDRSVQLGKHCAAFIISERLERESSVASNGRSIGRPLRSIAVMRNDTESVFENMRLYFPSAEGEAQDGDAKVQHWKGQALQVPSCAESSALEPLDVYMREVTSDVYWQVEHLEAPVSTTKKILAGLPPNALTTSNGATPAAAAAAAAIAAAAAEAAAQLYACTDKQRSVAHSVEHIRGDISWSQIILLIDIYETAGLAWTTLDADIKSTTDPSALMTTSETVGSSAVDFSFDSYQLRLSSVRLELRNVSIGWLQRAEAIGGSAADVRRMRVRLALGDEVDERRSPSPSTLGGAGVAPPNETRRGIAIDYLKSKRELLFAVNCTISGDAWESKAWQPLVRPWRFRGTFRRKRGLRQQEDIDFEARDPLDIRVTDEFVRDAVLVAAQWKRDLVAYQRLHEWRSETHFARLRVQQAVATTSEKVADMARSHARRRFSVSAAAFMKQQVAPEPDLEPEDAIRSADADAAVSKRHFIVDLPERLIVRLACRSSAMSSDVPLGSMRELVRLQLRGMRGEYYDRGDGTKKLDFSLRELQVADYWGSNGRRLSQQEGEEPTSILVTSSPHGDIGRGAALGGSDLEEQLIGVCYNERLDESTGRAVVREINVQCDRLHVEWNPDIVTDIVRFWGAVSAPIMQLETELEDDRDADDDDDAIGMIGGSIPEEGEEEEEGESTSGGVGLTLVKGRVRFTATLRRLSLSLARPERPTAPLLTVILSRVTAGADYWVDAKRESSSYKLHCALGNLVANAVDPRFSDPNVLRLKLAGPKTPRAQSQAASSVGGGTTQALVLRYSNEASDDIDGEFYMRLQPARLIYVHGLALDVVDYLAEGVMGSLLRSTAESAGGLIESELQESPRIAFDVMIEHPTLIVPESLSASQRNSIVATLQRGIAIKNKFELVETTTVKRDGVVETTSWPADVIQVDVKGMMLECDGQRLLGDDTDLSLRIVRALDSVGSDSVVGVKDLFASSKGSDSSSPVASGFSQRLDIDIDARFPVGIIFRSSQRAYRCIMRTLTSNFGGKSDVATVDRESVGKGKQQSKHSKTAAAFAGAVVATKSAKATRPVDLKHDGLLMKLDSTKTKWSLRYFAILGDQLVYFRDGDVEPRFSYDMSTISVRELDAVAPSLIDYGALDVVGAVSEEETSATKAQRDGAAFAKERMFYQRRNCFVVVTETKSFTLRAASEKSMHEWMDCILCAIAAAQREISIARLSDQPRRRSSARLSVIARSPPRVTSVRRLAKKSRTWRAKFSLFIPAIELHISTAVPLALFKLDSLKVHVGQGIGDNDQGSSATTCTATIFGISIHDERPSAMTRPFTHLLRRTHSERIADDAQRTMRNVETMLFVGDSSAEQQRRERSDQLRFEWTMEPQAEALTEEVLQRHRCRLTLLGCTGFAVYDALSDITNFFSSWSKVSDEERALERARSPSPMDGLAPTDMFDTVLPTTPSGRPVLCTDDEYEEASRYVDAMPIPAMPTSDSFDLELCATHVYALVLEDAKNANTSALALKVNTVGRAQLSRSRGDVLRPTSSVGQQLSLNLLVDSAECVASPGLQLRASNVQLLAPARGSLEGSFQRIPGCVGAGAATLALQSVELHLSYATWMIVQQVLRGWNALPGTEDQPAPVLAAAVRGAGHTKGDEVGDGDGVCDPWGGDDDELADLPTLKRQARPRANALKRASLRRASFVSFMSDLAEDVSSASPQKSQGASGNKDMGDVTNTAPLPPPPDRATEQRSLRRVIPCDMWMTQNNMRFSDSLHPAAGSSRGPAPNVFSADASSFWQARDGREHWVAFDLKLRRRVTQFVYYNRERSARSPKECSLQYADSLDGPWTLAKLFVGVNKVGEIVVDRFITKSHGNKHVDARYFRLLVHSTYGGTTARHHGATVTRVKFVGGDSQATSLSYQRDVDITTMLQLAELSFTQGFASIEVDEVRHIIVGIRYRDGQFEDIYDGLQLGELLREITDARARASTPRTASKVWCTLRVVKDGALRHSTSNVAVSGSATRSGALPTASWFERSSVEVQSVRAQIECGRAQVVLVDDYGGVDLPLLRMRADETRQNEPALRVRLTRLMHKWARHKQLGAPAGSAASINPDAFLAGGEGGFGRLEATAEVNMRVAIDYFEHAVADDVVATRSAGDQMGRGVAVGSASRQVGHRASGSEGGSGGGEDDGTPTSAISVVDNSSNSGSWCECMGVCPINIKIDSRDQTLTMVADEMLRINITTFFIRQARSMLTDLITRIERDSKAAHKQEQEQEEPSKASSSSSSTTTTTTTTSMPSTASTSSTTTASKSCPFVFHNDSGTHLDFWIEHQVPLRRMRVEAGERYEFFLPRLGALGNERQRPQTLALEFDESSSGAPVEWGTLSPLPVTRLGAYAVTLGAARLRAIWEVSSDTASGVTLLSIHSAVKVLNQCNEQIDVELLGRGDSSFFVTAAPRSSMWAPMRQTLLLEALSLRLGRRPKYAQSAPTSFLPGGAIHFCPIRPPSDAMSESSGMRRESATGRPEGPSAMALHAASYAADREDAEGGTDAAIRTKLSWTANTAEHVSSTLNNVGDVGPATNVFDGKGDATCWCAVGGKAEQWLVVDMERRYRVSTVSLRTAGVSDVNPNECSLLCAENIRGPWRRAVRFKRSNRGGSIPVAVSEVSRFWKIVVHSTHGASSGDSSSSSSGGGSDAGARLSGILFHGRIAVSPEKFAVCVDVDDLAEAHATVIRLRPPFVVRNLLPCRLACRLDGVEGARVRGIAEGMEHHFHVLDWEPDMSCASFRPEQSDHLAAVTLAMRGRRGVFTSLGRPGHAAEVVQWMQPDAEIEAERLARAERQRAIDQVNSHEQRTVGDKAVQWLKRLGTRDVHGDVDAKAMKLQRAKAASEIDLNDVRMKANEIREANGYGSRVTKTITLRHMIGGAPLMLNVTQQLEGARALSTAVLVVRSHFWIVNNSTLRLRFAEPQHRRRVERAMVNVAELEAKMESEGANSRAKSAASLAQMERAAVQPWSGEVLCVGVEGVSVAQTSSVGGRCVAWAQRHLDVALSSVQKRDSTPPGTPVSGGGASEGSDSSGGFEENELVVKLARGHERRLRVSVSTGPGSLYPTRIVTIYPSVVLASFVGRTLLLRHCTSSSASKHLSSQRGEVFVNGDRRPLWPVSTSSGKHTIALALADDPASDLRWSHPLDIDELGDTLLALQSVDGIVRLRAEVRPAPARMAHRLVLLYEMSSENDGTETGAAGRAGNAGTAAAAATEDTASEVAAKSAAIIAQRSSFEFRARLNGLEVSLFDGSATSLASKTASPRGVTFIVRGIQLAANHHPSAPKDAELAVIVDSLQLRVQSNEGGTNSGSIVVRSVESVVQPLINTWLRMRFEPRLLVLVGFHAAIGEIELFLDAAAARTILYLAQATNLPVPFLESQNAAKSDASPPTDSLGSIACGDSDVQTLVKELASGAHQPSNELLASSALQRRLYVEQFAFEGVRLKLNVDASAIEELAAMFAAQINVAVLTIVRRVMTSRSNMLKVSAFARNDDAARIPWGVLEDKLRRNVVNQVIRQISLRVLDPTRLLGISIKKTWAAAIDAGMDAVSPTASRSTSVSSASDGLRGILPSDRRDHALALPLQPPAPPPRYCSTLFVLSNLSSSTLILRRATVAGGEWISTGVAVRSPPTLILPGSFGVWQSSSQIASSSRSSFSAGSTVFGTCLYAIVGGSGGATMPEDPLAIVWCNGVSNTVPMQEVRAPAAEDGSGGDAIEFTLTPDKSLHATAYITLRDVVTASAAAAASGEGLLPMTPRGNVPSTRASFAGENVSVKERDAVDEDLAVWLPLSGHVNDGRAVQMSRMLAGHEVPMLHPPASFGPGRHWQPKSVQLATDASSRRHSLHRATDAALALSLEGSGGVTLPSRSVATLPSGNASRTIAVWAQLHLSTMSSKYRERACCLWSHGMWGSREIVAVVANFERRTWEVHVSAHDEVLRTSASLDSAWHHHCLVHDGAVLVYYLDGYEVLRHGVTLATPSPAVFELGGFVANAITYGSTVRLRSRSACACAERETGREGREKGRLSLSHRFVVVSPRISPPPPPRAFVSPRLNHVSPPQNRYRAAVVKEHVCRLCNDHIPVANSAPVRCVARGMGETPGRRLHAPDRYT